MYSYWYAWNAFISSDDDTHVNKPQIAMDEDLSSPEVDEEEEEEAPPKAPPIKPSPQLKHPPVVLKSAKDIELTESEEEDDTPEIMADEDVDEESAPPAAVHRSSSNKPQQKTKDVLSGEILFDVSPSVEKKKKKPAAKSSGLMLEFNLPHTPPQPTKKEVSKKDSPMGTPELSETKRESSKGKKKKSKKSRHGKDDEDEIKSGSGVGGAAQAPPVASDDPFGPIAALDAWLNSDATDPMVRDRVLYSILSLGNSG